MTKMLFTIRRLYSARCGRLWACLLAFMLGCVFSLPLRAQKPVTIAEEIEWTWEVRPPHPDPKLPNVLLLGDSIARNYFPEVREKLAAIANVYLMASSASIGDPRLEWQIAQFEITEKVRFRIVHFNNGMHGWAYIEEQYKAGFPKFVRAVRSLTEKNGSLIWATTTPVRSDANNGATNSRVQERTRIAREFASAAGIPVDDQFSLMQQHQDLYQNSVHFNSAGAKIQGDQATRMIRETLEMRH
jgi:hypothetical protein